MIARVFVLACIVAAALAADKFIYSQTWQSTDCSGTRVSWGWSKQPEAICEAAKSDCTQSTGIKVSSKVTCEASEPSGSFQSTTYNSTDCSGDKIAAGGGKPGVCLQATADTWVKGSCESDTEAKSEVFDNENCSGDPKSTVKVTVTKGCTENTVSKTSTDSQGCVNPVCFHKSTKISYDGGVEMTMADFQNGKESRCHVPHTVVADGVEIMTSCGKSLRLTNDHLVFTREGLVRAEDVHVGDVLFTNMAESVDCNVVEVKAEQQQEYFGLNCLKSEVLANGLKTSTFGVAHRVPAFFMKWVGKAVGVKKASAAGDFFANVAAKLGLLN